MIRDTISATDLDVLLYIAENPRSVDDLARFMYITRNSALVRICRMKKKDLVTNVNSRREAPVYSITANGESFLVELAQKLKSFKWNRKAK